jgi:hypothetical protein
MSEETVVGVIPNQSRRKGLLGSETFNVVITTQRLVFVTMTAQMLKDSAAQANREAQAQGQGWLARTGAMMAAHVTFAQRYLTLSPEAALAETPGNFAVPHNQIKSIKISEAQADNDVDQVKIDTTQGKFNFTSRGINLNEIKAQLKSVLGNVVK